MHVGVTEAADGADHVPGDDATVCARMELTADVPADASIESVVQSLKENAEAVFDDATFRPMTRAELLADIRHDREGAKGMDTHEVDLVENGKWVADDGE